MKLTSPAFNHNQSIPSKYTCDGEDINPPLNIAKLPDGVKSFALIVDDPDAPSGNWDHWLLWNIEPNITEIPENSIPPTAVQGNNDFKRTDWGGPCPPSGNHRYFFKIYALDSTLILEEGSSKSELLQAIAGHILDQAELIGLYSRENIS